MAMTTAEKDAFADEAFKAIEHPLVDGVVEELLFNLGCKNEGLPRYGARKVAHYAAIVARAQALGIDPDVLRATDEEADEFMMELAQSFLASGKPVIGVVVERGQSE